MPVVIMVLANLTLNTLYSSPGLQWPLISCLKIANKDTKYSVITVVLGCIPFIKWEEMVVEGGKKDTEFLL